MTYFDTAYLLKCYLNEKGSEDVRSFARQQELIACCEYGRMELLAAFHRNLREGKIDRHYFETLIAQLEWDDEDHIWNWLPLNRNINVGVANAFRSLPASGYLRTGDAIHLCCAREYGIEEIYTNDTHVLKAAECFQLRGKNIIRNE